MFFAVTVGEVYRITTSLIIDQTGLAAVGWEISTSMLDDAEALSNSYYYNGMILTWNITWKFTPQATETAYLKWFVDDSGNPTYYTVIKAGSYLTWQRTA